MKRAEIKPGLWLDARRAVFFEAFGVLAVADLHWGYAASHRAQGNLLPLWGDDQIAQGLWALIAEYRPKEMVWLGDSLHTLAGRQHAEEFLREVSIPTAILPGNHDRRWERTGGLSLQRGDYFFHHGDAAPALPTGVIEVIGHHHPAFDWYDGTGSRMKFPALVQHERRLILPAFSPWAAGSPWGALLAEDEQLWVVSPQRVFAVTPAMLRRR